VCGGGGVGVGWVRHGVALHREGGCATGARANAVGRGRWGERKLRERLYLGSLWAN
jgi:hypothetical protein